MPDKCLDCPAPSADMDGFIVSGPGGAPRSEGSGVSSPEGPFVREAPQTGHVVIMGTLGADGNPGSLPDAPQVGWAYVAEDAGTYGGVQATEGDMVYCMSLNPVRWGVLQADSDDSGRDLVGVSADFECSGWTAAADAYGWNVVGQRYTEGAAPYGPESFEFSEGTLTTVWTESMFADYMDAYFQIGGSEYHARADLRILFSGSPAAKPLGGFSWPAYGPLPARLALDSVSFAPDPAAPGYRLMTAAFRAEKRAPSTLSVSETLAGGTSRTSSSDASCLDSAAVSVKADASCAGAVVPSPYAELSVRTDSGTSWYTDYMENLDCRSGSFVLGGAHTDYVMRSFSSAAYVRLEFELDGSPWRYSSYYNDFAGVFTGTVPAGTAFPLEPAVSGTPSVYSLVVAERTELTSEDEGGPDVLVRFQLVRNGGPSVAVVAETLGGDVSVDTADLSCMVPPVFDGSANGLVPVNSPATQTADLLSDDGTWMRPATDAEIDALFAE